MPRTSRAAISSILSAAFMTIALLLSGCSGGGGKKLAQNYIDNLKFYNYPFCYQALSHQDQIDKNEDDFLKEVPLAPDVSTDWFKAVLHVSNYEVGESKSEGDTKQVVTVKVTRPDLPLWERTVDAKLTGDTSPDQAAQKTLEDNSFPKVTYDDNIVAVNEAGNWKVFVDFPAHDAIEKKHGEAIDAYHKHDYDKAIATYQSAIADLDKEEATGNAGLKFLYQRERNDIQNIKNQMSDAQAYIPKLTLSDVDMKMSASGVPAIFGKITNGGDKAIDEVVVTVTYSEGKGKKKKQVFTEEHSIVVTPLEFINFSRAVLPFVPTESRNFGFKLTAPPDVQRKASPDLEVTGVVFTQSTAPLPAPQVLPSPTPASTPGAAAAPSAPSSAPAGGSGQAPLPPPPPH
jgi:hypothetical protein